MIHNDWKRWGMAIQAAEGSSELSWNLAKTLAATLLDLIREGKPKSYVHDILRMEEYWNNYETDSQVFLFDEFSYDHKKDFDNTHNKFLDCVKKNVIMCLI